MLCNVKYIASRTRSISLGRTMNTDMHGGKTTAGNTESGGGRRWSRWRIAAWAAAALILLLPLVAMQFTEEVRWTASDFAAAAALLGGGALLFEIASRRLPTARARWIGT